MNRRSFLKTAGILAIAPSIAVRLDDMPTIVWADGTKLWFRNGKLHRKNGPAIEWSHGGREWHFNGKKHRTDGPATEMPNGNKWYWINGEPLTEVAFNRRLL